jgi:hypothetical protein
LDTKKSADEELPNLEVEIKNSQKGEELMINEKEE